MKQHLYTTGQLAEKAFVTIRTLRYYDKVGLLKPSHHSDGGHRLYTNEDLLRLEQILGLKFLGILPHRNQALFGNTQIPDRIPLDAEGDHEGQERAD